jgi:hypothetical protein
MIRDAHEEIEASFQGKRYYIYAPQSAHSLRQQYRELGDNPILRDLSATDMLFVWWFANRTSPIADLPEKERVVIAVEKSYARSNVQAKIHQYSGTGKELTFPDTVRAAILEMASFDPAGRISAIADDLHLLKQYQSIIRKDVSSGELDEITEWMKAVKAAREGRDDILAKLERGGRGVMESTGDTFTHLEGVAAEFVITNTD